VEQRVCTLVKHADSPSTSFLFSGKQGGEQANVCLEKQLMLIKFAVDSPFTHLVFRSRNPPYDRMMLELESLIPAIGRGNCSGVVGPELNQSMVPVFGPDCVQVGVAEKSLLERL
jgi:hypothetical protein